MRSTLSVLGLYSYDNTVFSGLKLPACLEPDRDTIVNNILLECAELEVLYPDPGFFKNALMFWSETRQYTWEELWKTMHYKYNPIWNKDGTITETRSGTNTLDINSKETNDSDIKDIETRNLNNIETNNTSNTQSRQSSGNASSVDENEHTGSGSSGGNTDNFVTGFNSNTPVKDRQEASVSSTQQSDNTKNVGSTATAETETIKNDNTGSVNRQDAGTIVHSNVGGENATKNQNELGTSTDSLERVEQGNIGVTSTQSLIKEQREVVLFNVVTFIINDFKKRFCIMLY